MFVTKIRAADRSPWGDYWFKPVGQGTMSGMRVTADTAMQLSAVFRAVQLVSGHMAMFPVKFYKAGTHTAANHPLLKLLNKRPNRFQNSYEWRQMLQGHLELRGNAYNEIMSNSRGDIVELMPRHPDKVVIDQLPSGDYRYLVTDPDGTVRVVPRGSMWHLRGLSSNGISGMSVIEYARESFGLGLAAQSYGARFFANDAKPSGGWIEFTGTFKDKPQREAFKESWQETQSGINKGKLAVLENGMKYHEIGLTNEDAQFIETRKFSISDIARWFGVPAHKIGDMSASTNNNIEQQALEYIQDALLTRATMWEASIVSELLFDDEEFDIEFNFRELLRGDSGSRRAYYHGGIQDGWLTRNEARDMEGMEPLDGLDEPLRPLNMVEENEAEDLEQSEPPNPNDQSVPGEPPGKGKKGKKGKDESAKRLESVLASNASRLARKFIKSGKADAELIVDALATDAALTLRWCEINFPAMKDEQEIIQSLLKLGEII
jgi:HK97 family phage portal protein